MVSFVTRAGVVSLLVSVVFLGGCAAYDASSDYRLADDAADAFLEAVEKGISPCCWMTYRLMPKMHLI